MLVPWKAIYLATALLLVGSMFIILGVLIKVGIITSEVSFLGVLLYRYMHLQQKKLKLTDWRTDMARQRHSIPSLRLYHVYPRRLPLLCSLLCLLSLSWIRLLHDSRHGLTICNEIILYEAASSQFEVYIQFTSFAYNLSVLRLFMCFIVEQRRWNKF